MIAAVRRERPDLEIRIAVTSPDRMSFREQLRVVRESRVLVGFHGAGLTHLLFLFPEASVLEITVLRYWMRSNFGTMARNANVTYMLHTIPTGNDQQGAYANEFTLDPANFLQLLSWHAPAEGS